MVYVVPATSRFARLPKELRDVIAGLAVSVGLCRTDGGELSHCRAEASRADRLSAI
jgi:hypothetical protein